MNPITVTLICFGLIALMVLIVYFAIEKGKRNAEPFRQKHDLIVGEASPYVIAKAVGEYNQKYNINPDDHEVIIMYVRK